MGQAESSESTFFEWTTFEKFVNNQVRTNPTLKKRLKRTLDFCFILCDSQFTRDDVKYQTQLLCLASFDTVNVTMTSNASQQNRLRTIMSSRHVPSELAKTISELVTELPYSHNPERKSPEDISPDTKKSQIFKIVHDASVLARMGAVGITEALQIHHDKDSSDVLNSINRLQGKLLTTEAIQKSLDMHQFSQDFAQNLV